MVEQSGPSGGALACSLSVVIPVFNEAKRLPLLLADLQRLQQIPLFNGESVAFEIIVVDAGSSDGSAALAQQGADRVLRSSKGRAVQLQTGVNASRGRLIWLLHSDSRLDQAALARVAGLAREQETPCWGRLDVRLDDPRWMFRVIAWFINWRSRLTQIATGDQGIFANRTLLDQVGGVPEQALMEDVELSKRLRRLVGPLCLHEKITTSARRWQQRGVWRTILLMWSLRLRYFLGADPARLLDRYR